MIALLITLLHWLDMGYAYHMLVGVPAVGYAPWCQVFSTKPAQRVEQNYTIDYTVSGYFNVWDGNARQANQHAAIAPLYPPAFNAKIPHIFAVATVCKDARVELSTAAQTPRSGNASHANQIAAGAPLDQHAFNAKILNVYILCHLWPSPFVVLVSGGCCVPLGAPSNLLILNTGVLPKAEDDPIARVE